MSTTRALSSWSLPACVLALCLLPLPAQPGAASRPTGSGPTTREQMWWAPTAEDWQKPVLVKFQRSWEDAQRLAAETRQPILVCVNMDGEIASEHYAGVRYRMPEIAKLYTPYICVIASVYRHNPRDYDEHGQRILCPRFGSVTCGEHIAIEPVLYEKFMDGRRIAPRHIMVELDGKETYDVFYAWDTASVFQAIGDGIAKRSIQAAPPLRGDRTLLERVASSENSDQVVVEQAYREGDAALRKQLLAAAVQRGAQAPVDLLRLALFGLDPELAETARKALASTQAPGAVDLIAEALRVPMPAEQKDALVQALVRLGEASPRARTLAVVHQGLATRSAEVDVEGWAKSLAGAEYPAPVDRSALEAQLDSKGMAARTQPKDAMAWLELAESALAFAIDPATAEMLARDPRTARKYARLYYEEAQHAAQEAEKLGAPAWRVNSVLAVVADQLGNHQEALARAVTAAQGTPQDAKGYTAMAVMALYAEARQRAISDRIVQRQPWPKEWLTDVHAAYSVLARHPLGTDIHVVSHFDFLDWLGAKAQAARVLDEGLARFPESWVLHDRLRLRILAERGAEGLEGAYASMMAAPGARPGLVWFAGYAAIVHAEFHRRAGRSEQALAAYDRAIAHYEQSIRANPVSRDSSDHYIAIAHAGRARIAFEAKQYETAVQETLASFQRRSEAAATQDGLNLSAVDTAKALLARLQQEQRKDLAATVDAALKRLDPVLLQLPAYERETPAPESRPRRRRG